MFSNKFAFLACRLRPYKPANKDSRGAGAYGVGMADAILINWLLIS